VATVEFKYPSFDTYCITSVTFVPNLGVYVTTSVLRIHSLPVIETPLIVKVPVILVGFVTAKIRAPVPGSGSLPENVTVNMSESMILNGPNVSATGA